MSQSSRFPQDGELYGTVLSQGGQFALTFTPFEYVPTGKTETVSNPNVTLWSEDDGQWFYVYDFHPAWISDLVMVLNHSLKHPELEQALTAYRARYEKASEGTNAS